MTNDFILRYSTIEKLDIIFWKKKVYDRETATSTVECERLPAKKKKTI